ncbi:MAG TPA: 2-polyprenyl-6-methoxyphenol hydroxylase-like oxidoreductase [Chloroflexota bacterium]|nr:2-polyprenyl-6-methoxyphenol hydroxylase-like oxidoreductase [Chloroflexota bacterium]
MTKLAFTRDLLDWNVRQRLLQNPKVRIGEKADVVGLEPSADGRGIRGVILNDTIIEADLVVDASGRGSRLPQWLRELGFDAPEEVRVNAHPGYASRLYEPPAGFTTDWRAVYMQAAPPRLPRLGVIFPVEGHRWLVTLAGGGSKHHPPTDEAGFLAFARSLPSPLIYDAIAQARPLTEIATTRSGENRLRRYDRLARWPGGLIVLGDAVCAFNPVYGQGMTVAALQALALQQALGQKPHPDTQGFQKEVAKIVALPWTLATSEDSRYEDTEGALMDRRTRLMHRYMDSVLALATEQVNVRRTLLELQHMLKPPSTLFGPKILSQVLLHSVPRSNNNNGIINVQEVQAVR